jgi:hypothetical protein
VGEYPFCWGHHWRREGPVGDVLYGPYVARRRDGSVPLKIRLVSLGSLDYRPVTAGCGEDTGQPVRIASPFTFHTLLQDTMLTSGGDRNHNLRIKNDTYSLGVSAVLMMSHPSADPVTTSPHNTTKAIPFSSVLIRERSRPESSLTTAELYFVLAMAAKHRSLLDTRSIHVGFGHDLLPPKLIRCSYAS